MSTMEWTIDPNNVAGLDADGNLVADARLVVFLYHIHEMRIGQIKIESQILWKARTYPLSTVNVNGNCKVVVLSRR